MTVIAIGAPRGYRKLLGTLPPGARVEHAVREIGLANGLVDVKVCAVDATWSGLKFVRRAKDR
jgi:hypothetical protein